MEQYGILFKNRILEDCPLEEVEVEANLDTEIAYVKVTQEYFYQGSTNTEAIYTFPVNYGAQVTGFSVKIGNDEIRGQLQDKDTAFRAYENAIRKGDSAFLLESHRSDIFQISLGNISPNERITITIIYSEDLKQVDDQLRWILPTVITPKYMPYGNEDESNIELNYGNAKYIFDINVSIMDKDRIKKVSSPSHALEFTSNNRDIIIGLGKEFEYLDRDFVLNISLNDSNENHFEIGLYGETEYYGMLRFVPELDDFQSEQTNKEYIFILDTSGSMEGEKIEQGKRALNIALRNLLEGDKFNIISFNNSYSIFDRNLVAYSQDNLNRAQKWIGSLEASGGTEIFKPLEYAITISKEKDIDRIIFLFTDGQVYNDQQIFEIIKDNGGIRIYPFGIDTAINKLFIDELANIGNGIPEYVYPGERIEDKVITQLARINQPFYTDVKLRNYFGEEIETFPVIPKNIYNGENYSFVFKADAENELSYVTFVGKVNGEEKKIKIEKNSWVDGELLRIKWAKENIKYLESILSVVNKRRGDLIKSDIVKLSIDSGVLSTQTSLVAVYERKDKRRGHINTITVPLNIPSGWRMFDNNISYQLKENIPNMISYDDFSLQDSRNNDLEMPMFLSKQSKQSKIPSISKPIDTTKELMLEVAAGQNADGSFGENNKGIKTSYFIIAILLYRKESKPYTKQIKKATFYLLNEHENDIETYIALKLAFENNIYKEMDIEDKIDTIEKNDKIGNSKHLYNILINNTEEFSAILFNESMKTKKLIRYLFNKI